MFIIFIRKIQKPFSKQMFIVIKHQNNKPPFSILLIISDIEKKRDRVQSSNAPSESAVID